MLSRPPPQGHPSRQTGHHQPSYKLAPLDPFLVRVLLGNQLSIVEKRKKKKEKKKDLRHPPRKGGARQRLSISLRHLKQKNKIVSRWHVRLWQSSGRAGGLLLFFLVLFWSQLLANVAWHADRQRQGGVVDMPCVLGIFFVLLSCQYACFLGNEMCSAAKNELTKKEKKAGANEAVLVVRLV